MTATSADLQRAVWTALTGDAALVSLLGGPKVFDAPPSGTPFPYVAFGRTSAFDWSTASEGGEEFLFSLHVWSRGRGRRETQAIAARLRVVLEALQGNFGACRVVQLRFRSAEWLSTDLERAQQCVLRFRAAVESL